MIVILFGSFLVWLPAGSLVLLNYCVLPLADVIRVLTTATHKSGNQLDLIYTGHCSTDHVLVTPLHTSDHFLLTLNLNMIPDTSHTPPHVTFRHNLRSLSRLSAMVSSSLPPLNSYHILMLTVLLTLSVSLWCLVVILSAPYLPGQPVPLLLPLGYLSFSGSIVLNSGLQKGYGANHKILLTLIFIHHSSLTFLLMSPLLKGHTIRTKLTIHLILACSLKHLPPSFVLLLPSFINSNSWQLCHILH